MKIKSVMLLAVAVGCGLVAMLGVQQVLSGRSSGDDAHTAKVLVAMMEISPGTPLDETNVSFKAIPQDAIPEGAITNRDQYDQRAAKFRLFPGDIVRMEKLGDQGVFGPSIEIPMGMRVVTVPVSLTLTHSGLMRPGDHVDILVSYQTRKPGVGTIKKTKCVLEDIKVFATDNVRDMEDGQGSDLHAKNVSLLVTPEQANILMHASNKGKLQLALRNGEDNDESVVADVDDTFFDDVESFGGTGDSDIRDPEPDQKPQAGNVAQFLNEQQQNQQVQAPAVKNSNVVAVDPTRPTWTMYVFDGDTLQPVSVELPLEETGEVLELSEAGTAADSHQSPFVNFFNQVFNPGNGSQKGRTDKDADVHEETDVHEEAAVTQ